MQVRTWIGFNSMDPNNAMDHFIQFSHSTGGSRACRNFLQLLWFALVWVLWTGRNNRLIKLKERSIMQLSDKVQLISFWRLKA